jgi:hypothetical protein
MKGIHQWNRAIPGSEGKYPYTIENNSEISVYGFRDAIKYRLGNRFSFNGNIISRKGQALTMQDVFADFSKNRDSFTLDELTYLLEKWAHRFILIQCMRILCASAKHSSFQKTGLLSTLKKQILRLIVSALVAISV